MHCHLASSTKLYLNRRLFAVFSSNKRSGTGERASTLFSGFAVFKNSTRLHFSWRSRAVSRETWKVLDRSDESFLLWLIIYWIQLLLRLYRACALDGLSFYERATIFCWLNSGKNALLQQNKDSRSVLSYRWRVREIPALPRPAHWAWRRR